MQTNHFVSLEVDRSIPMGELYRRVQAAGYTTEIMLLDDALLKLADPAAKPETVKLNVWDTRGLARFDGIQGVMRMQGLRMANLQEGIAFAIAHREAYPRWKPLIIAGSPVRLKRGRPFQLQAFGVEGQADLSFIEQGNYWGGVSFLAAKL